MVRSAMMHTNRLISTPLECEHTPATFPKKVFFEHGLEWCLEDLDELKTTTTHAVARLKKTLHFAIEID